MGQAFNVSDNIGFDGSSYYCRRCGKAGYGKATQVRGHLALCPGTLIRKGVSLTTGSNHLPTGNGASLRQQPAIQLQPLTGASSGDLGGGQLLQPVEVVGPVGNPLAGGYGQLEQRVTQMENEYSHLLHRTNQVPQGDWLNRNKDILILAVVVVVAVVYLTRQNGSQCENASDKSKTKGAFDKLGEKAVSTFANRAISKSVDSLFR